MSVGHARNVVSPGHHTLFTRAGHTYLLYHRHSVPYEKGKAYRQTCVDEIHFTSDGLIGKLTPIHTGPALLQGRNANRLAATTTASTRLDSNYAAARVLDDNYASRWAPSADALGGWLQLDLGAAQPVGRIEVRFEYAWKPYRFTLEASADGFTWTTLADHRPTPFTGSPYLVAADAKIRYLRLVFPTKAKPEEMSVWEFAAFPL